MIWVDNRGQRPAGNDTGQSITVGGVTYRIWDTGNHRIISLVQPNSETGSADILGIIKTLIGRGAYPSTIGLNMVAFGFEAPSTGGTDETFSVYDSRSPTPSRRSAGGSAARCSGRRTTCGRMTSPC